MPSKTLSSKGWFSRTLFCKDLSRFWPLWTVYTLIWLVVLPASSFIMLFSRNGYVEKADRVWMAVSTSGQMLNEVCALMAIVFGCLFAMALFSYLHSARSVGFAHALPLRREGHFLTRFAVGVVGFLVPNLVVAGITAAVWAAGGVTDFRVLGAWLLCASGEMLFFFALAAFCAMFTGQVLAVPVFYAILNAVVYTVNYVLQHLAAEFIYGYASGFMPRLVEWLTPFFKWSSDVGVTLDYDKQTVEGFYGLGAVGIYLAVGVVLAAAALAVSRYRRSESAGDVVAVGWAKPVFRFGAAVCFALTLGQGLYYLTYASFTERVSAAAMAVCMILLGLAGYFAAEMLLQKSFRVFRSGWIGAGAVSVALAVLCAGFSMDVFHIADRIPDMGRVDHMNVHLYGNTGLDVMNLKDPELMARFQDLHRSVTEERPEVDDAYTEKGTGVYALSLDLDYCLKNDTKVSRSYSFTYTDADLANPDSIAAQTAALARDPKVQLAVGDSPERETVTGGSLQTYVAYTENSGWQTGNVNISAENAQILLNAFRRDVEAGHAGTDFLGSRETWRENTYSNYLYIYYMTLREDGPAEQARRGAQIELSFSKNYTYLLDALTETGIIESAGDLTTKAQERAAYDSDTSGISWTVG